ncbi:uncharacterized protein LOC116287752 [Actinia tenebrosa]|uniref:Uncharacterized protein LOC116287752 n=1 Tax=Actinia tenebrosa TaxID=6105 RepID=A0A6P8H404_ACTTE|nr:uncharacterized protein LOC116287752 [Actinia tenebrosa]
MVLMDVDARIDGLTLGQHAGYDFPEFAAPIDDFVLPLKANEPPSTGQDHGATGYDFRSYRPQNTAIDLDEFDRQREMSEQRRLAALWANAAREIEAETNKLKNNTYFLWDPSSAIENVDKVTALSESFEDLHPVFLNGIKDRKRLEFVEVKYRELKESMMHIIQECRMRMQTDRQGQAQDDNVSVESYGSQRSQRRCTFSTLSPTATKRGLTLRGRTTDRTTCPQTVNKTRGRSYDDSARTSTEKYRVPQEDPIAAKWKIQLLNGFRPRQFSGKPSGFPFFCAQIKNHLEGDLLIDAQRVEYLPKFLIGDALEVLKRNRGCSYETIVQVQFIYY